MARAALTKGAQRILSRKICTFSAQGTNPSLKPSGSLRSRVHVLELGEEGQGKSKKSARYYYSIALEIINAPVIR